MRILLHAWGSRGDVQPTLALATGLRDAGHDVALAAALDFEDWIRGHGIRFEPFDIDLGAQSRSDLGRQWLGGTSTSTVAELRLMREVMRGVADTIARTLAATTDAYDAVVTTPILLEAMLSMSVARGRRLACALLQPSVGTRHGSSYVYAPRPGRSMLNGLVGAVVALGIRPVISPIGDATRALAGLPRLTWLDYTRLTLATPFLLGASPVVVPPAPDWPVRVDVTGYWWLDEPARALTPDVEAFLAAGPPPVYVGFGSMAAADPPATSRLVTEAIAAAGVRAVVLRGVADLDVPPRDDVLVIEQAPHDALFPRCAAVVGHGGAGTTAAAFRAGVPQVVVPHMGDQPYWGRRVHELGVGPAPIPRRSLTPGGLAAAIRAALTADHARTASEVSARLRDERGVDRAVASLAAAWGP